MRRVNGGLIFLGIVMIPLAVEHGWWRSVGFVVSFGLWALVSGHWSPVHAARVEVEQRRQRQQGDRIVELAPVDELMELSTGIGTETARLARSDRPEDAVGSGGASYPPPTVESQARWT